MYKDIRVITRAHDFFVHARILTQAEQDTPVKLLQGASKMIIDNAFGNISRAPLNSFEKR